MEHEALVRTRLAHHRARQGRHVRLGVGARQAVAPSHEGPLHCACPHPLLVRLQGFAVINQRTPAASHIRFCAEAVHIVRATVRGCPAVAIEVAHRVPVPHAWAEIVQVILACDTPRGESGVEHVSTVGKTHVCRQRRERGTFDMQPGVPSGLFPSFPSNKTWRSPRSMHRRCRPFRTVSHAA